MIVWLKVPFAEKDEAKALGARWSPPQKKWYVKDADNLDAFERWLDPSAPENLEGALPAASGARKAPSVRAVEIAAPEPSTSVVIYCDGACRGNPGAGGWGAIVKTPEGELEAYGGMPSTTNNRMELTAAIEGLRAAPPGLDVTVMTDSQYVVKGMTEWRHGWVRKNWKDVKNAELWKALIDEAANHPAVFRWVRGHNGHDGNERADALANAGLEHALRTRTTDVVIRRVESA